MQGTGTLLNCVAAPKARSLFLWDFIGGTHTLFHSFASMPQLGDLRAHCIFSVEDGFYVCSLQLKRKKLLGATRFQLVVRHWRARRHFRNHMLLHRAAVRIQCLYRYHHSKLVAMMLRARLARRNLGATGLQRLFRGVRGRERFQYFDRIRQADRLRHARHRRRYDDVGPIRPKGAMLFVNVSFGHCSVWSVTVLTRGTRVDRAG